jgi:poly(hydroxyalkanoate) granule-associated protein
VEENPMTDQVDSDSEKKHHEPGPMFETSRKILLAAIGAVAYAQDEVEEFINRLVERGEIAEKEGKQLAKEMQDKRKSRWIGMDSEINNRFRDALERLNVPTKKDVNDLSDKIAELTKKVEELRKSKE